MRTLALASLYLAVSLPCHAGPIGDSVRKALATARASEVNETGKIRMGTSRPFKESDLPKACARYADACRESMGIAQLRDGTLAVQKNQTTLKILPPEGMGKDIEIAVPNWGNSDNKVALPRLNAIDSSRGSYFEYSDGALGLTDGSQFQWSRRGELNQGIVKATQGNNSFFMRVYRLDEGSYEITARVIKKSPWAKPIEIKSRFYAAADETISAITDVDVVAKTALISGHNKKGERFQRTIGLKLPASTQDAPGLPGTNFPGAGAI